MEEQNIFGADKDPQPNSYETPLAERMRPRDP